MMSQPFSRFPASTRIVAACLVAMSVLCGANSGAQDVGADDGRPFPDPPQWIQDNVLYEVNLRQFSDQGTVAGFRPHLPRLKALGVDILWFMPIHPIGVEARSGELGSYYAVQDHMEFNPEFGTLEEFKALVDQAHDMGMYVIIDWVPNHTAPDHPWVGEHPEWYTRDDDGRLVPPIPEWADVVDLNYDAMDMRRQMIEQMSFWVREVGVDGFRCDTAEWQPLDFWVDARNALWEIKPVFMLAEGAKPELVEYAFDSLYAWDLTANMEQIAAGTKDVADLINYLDAEARLLPAGGFRMNFTTNHDKNSWEGTDTERLGDGLAAFTVLSYTVTGMPLIYSGQEAGNDRRLAFFDRDPITWRDHPMADLYSTLAHLKRNNRALWHGGAGGPLKVIEASTNNSVLTFQREAMGDRVVVMLNLSGDNQEVRIPADVNGLHRVLGEDDAPDNGGMLTLEPWSYRVWSSTPAASSMPRN